ncbi:hypothetical protein VKS41_003738 [Umbelopsis sp. WA50703]
MTKLDNAKKAWGRVGDDAATLKDDLGTAVKDSGAAATAGANKARRDSSEAWKHVKGHVEEKVHEAHENVEAVKTARHETAESIHENAQSLFGRAQELANYVFSIKGNIQSKVDKVKEDLESSKKHESVPDNSDSWFALRDVIEDRRSQWRSLEDTAEALKKSATDRKQKIEDAILGLPEDAKAEAEKVRDAIADWSRDSRENTKKLVNEVRGDWDKTVDDVSHGFEHAAHDISDAFDKPSDHHLKLHIHEAINNINKKLAVSQVEMENKYNKLDKELRSKFDVAAFKAGKLKGEYNHLRDDTAHIIRKRRKDAMNQVKQDYDSFVRDARIKLYEAEQALKEYRSAPADKVEEKKKIAQDKIKSLEKNMPSEVKSVTDRANAVLDAADAKVDEAWASALDTVHEAKKSAFNAWGSAKNKVKDAKKDAHHAVDRAHDRAEGAAHHAFEKVHGAYHHATNEIESLVDSSTQAINAFGERVKPGEQYAPVATAWGALFAIWFAFLAIRVWNKRKQAKVWVGDGTLEYMKAMYAPDSVTEVAEYHGETSDSDTQKPSRADSAIDVNGRRGKRVTRTVVSKTVKTTTATTAQKQASMHEDKQRNLHLYQALTHAVHDLSSYTSTIPFFMIVLAVMEFNGFDWRLLNCIYLSLFFGKLLQSQAGQEYAEEFLGVDQDFGNGLVLAVTAVVSVLTIWSLLTLEIPLIARDIFQHVSQLLNPRQS